MLRVAKRFYFAAGSESLIPWLKPFSVSLAASVILSLALVAWVGSREVSAKFHRSLQAPHDPASWLRYGAADWVWAFWGFGLFLEAASVLLATLKGVAIDFCIVCAVAWCISAWSYGLPSYLANLLRRRFSFSTTVCPVNRSYQNSLQELLVYTRYCTSQHP